MKIILSLSIIITLTQLKAMSQNITDTVLDGQKLLNLKLANPSKYYRYEITPTIYTLLKFKKGSVVNCKFHNLKSTILKIDTHYFKGGYNVLSKNVQGNYIYNMLSIYKRNDPLSLIILAHDSVGEYSQFSNRYTYYSNKQLSCISKHYLFDKSSQDISYERNGRLSFIETRDSLEKLKEVTFYNKHFMINWTMRINDGINVRKQFDCKGNLIQVDSTFKEKQTSTRISYYPNKNIKVKACYINDRQDGTCNIYYEDSRLKATETYILEKKVGRYIYYNKDGTIKKEGVYK